MKFRHLLYLLVFAISACENEKIIEFEHMYWKDGLMTDSTTHQILDGKYKTVEPISPYRSGDHVSTYEFDKGIPTGEWTYSFNGDPIHNGKYLDEPEVSWKISQTTGSQRTDLDLWWEGDNPFLTIHLIQPEKIDTNNLIKISTLAEELLAPIYHFNRVYIRSITNKEHKELFILDYD